MRGRIIRRALVVAFLAVGVATAAGCGGLPYGAQNAVRPGATVEAYRLDPSADRAGPDEPQTFDGFKVRSGPVTLKPEAAARLTDVLTNRFTFKTRLGGSDCPFKPLVGFRYVAESPFDVVVSFDCNEAKFVQRTAAGRRTERDDDVSNGRKELVESVKGIFPDDPDVQALDPGKPWKAGGN